MADTAGEAVFPSTHFYEGQKAADATTGCIRRIAAPLFALCFLHAAVAQAQVTLSPTSLTFGAQGLYTVSNAQTVTLSNQQNVPLNFSSIRAGGDFHQSNTCGSSVTCTVSVTFRPTALGTRTGAVQFTDNAGNSPQVLRLSGSAIPEPVTTYHYDNSRTGADLAEVTLTPANVNVNQFGKLFSVPVDAGILAQPLYIPNLQIPGLGIHNVIFVVTQHNSLYAFDADNGATLWAVNVGPYQPMNTCTPEYDIGINGTPVIDPSTKTIYLAAATLRDGVAQHELHALDITTGAERPFSPVVITASVRGTGFGMAGGILTFSPLNQRQRPALLLDNGTVYVGFASYCDQAFTANGHGWLFAYNAASLQRTGLFVSSPNGYGSGIWAAGGGPAADANHNIYLSTGNGDFDADQGGSDYGDSVVKLKSKSLAILDYFTPFNQATLAASDTDLGSGGITLLPDQASSPPHLMVTAGHQGVIYLINRDSLGGYNSSVDKVVQEVPGNNGLFSTPAVWNSTLYFGANKDYPKAFSFAGGMISTIASSRASISNFFSGFVPVISARRQTNGILWALQRTNTQQSGVGTEVLHAYAATNLADELYNSNQAGTRDVIGMVGRNFESITVANGKVYVPTGQPGLTVFGLLAAP